MAQKIFTTDTWNEFSANMLSLSEKVKSTNIGYGTCSTAAATAAKIITIVDNGQWTLTAGSFITVLFTNTNTAKNPTFNVNGTGAKNVFYTNSQITTSSLSYAGYANRPMNFMYDGTQYRFIGWGVDSNSDTKVKQENLTSNSDRSVLLASNNTTAAATTGTYKSTKLKYNPSTDTLTVGTVNGTATYATNAGTATQAEKATSATSATYATTATKAGTANSASTATVDNKGQAITDYIKGFGISGKTITITKGNGTTSTYTTQDNNTTYSNYKGASSSASGTAGLVPAATSATYGNFLRGDGVWAIPSKATSATSATYSSTATYANNAGTSSYSSNGAKATSATSATYATTASKAGTATALSGVTASATELNYVDGVTSNIQTQLDNKIDADGDVYFNGDIYLENTRAIMMESLGNGTYYPVMSIGNSGTLFIGNGYYENATGYSTSIGAGNQIQLKVPNETILLFHDGTDGYFRPTTNGKCYLGGSSFRWNKIYSATATVQTSDAREKENIIPFGAGSIMTLSLDENVEQIDIHSELFDRLQPVQYNLIDGNGRICYGLIAQDVASAIEELGYDENDLDLVYHEYYKDEETGEEKDTYGIAYANLIPMNIYEIQKLKSIVATSNTEIALLKEEIALLKEEIALLK